MGGNSVLPMAGLKSLLEGLGWQNVRTYIQSGNVVFEYEELNISEFFSRVCAEIQAKYGFEPAVWLLTPADLQRALALNPFPQAESNLKTLHIFFLTSTPQPEWEKLEALRKPNERYELREDFFYLYAPDGIGRSKLAANLERLLGVAITGRNLRTVHRILELAQEDF